MKCSNPLIPACSSRGSFLLLSLPFELAVNVPQDCRAVHDVGGSSVAVALSRRGGVGGGGGTASSLGQSWPSTCGARVGLCSPCLRLPPRPLPSPPSLSLPLHPPPVGTVLMFLLMGADIFVSYENSSSFT